MRNFFDVIAPIYEMAHQGALKTFKKIEEISGGFSAQDVVVDLGGGTGRITKFLSNKVQKVIVVDSSEEMLKQCRARHPSLSCAQADAQNLPFANETVNKVLIIDAFHHFKCQERVVKEINRVLVKNGKVIIEEFNPSKIVGKIALVIEKALSLGSIFHTPSSLAGLFVRNGFKTRLFNEHRSSYYLIGEKIN